MAAPPGARRREYRFLDRRAGHPVEEERDGDVTSAMRGTGRASEGNRGLPGRADVPKTHDVNVSPINISEEDETRYLLWC